MARECPTPASALNQPVGNQGYVAHPLPAKLLQPAVGPMHSHPYPGQRPASMKAAQRTDP